MKFFFISVKLYSPQKTFFHNENCCANSRKFDLQEIEENIRKAKEEATAEGLGEGLAKGRAEAHAEALAETHRSRMETAKKLIDLGIQTKIISEITGLTEADISNLK